jgi:hypothetical protein
MEAAMKKFAVKTRFSFTGAFFVEARNTMEAKGLVEQSCGLVLGGDPHSSLPADEVDWDFPVHPEKKVFQPTACHGRRSP